MTARPQRRDWLAALGGLLVAGSASAAEAPPHEPFGPVLPRLAAPRLRLTDDSGRPGEWPALMKGRRTAVQLMFTGCSATCPIQGALFAELAARVHDPGVQLLSLSIDPLNDTPAALRAWLAKFGSAAGWRAAVPDRRDADRLVDFLKGRAPGVDRHTAQVYLFDRNARLAYRTEDMPAPARVAELLALLARAG